MKSLLRVTTTSASEMKMSEPWATISSSVYRMRLSVSADTDTPTYTVYWDWITEALRVPLHPLHSARAPLTPLSFSSGIKYCSLPTICKGLASLLSVIKLNYHCYHH